MCLCLCFSPSLFYFVVVVSPFSIRKAGTGTPLSADEDGGLFSGTVHLPRGKHSFRFIVDGQWCHDPELPTGRDEASGELCNVVLVSLKREHGLKLPEKVRRT